MTFRFASRALAIASFALATTANAATLLTYEFAGKTGSEVSDAATTAAAGLTGSDMVRNLVTTNAGANSFNSKGWDAAGGYVSFGFTVNSGFAASINQIMLGTKVSGTGPSLVNLLVSIDGGAFSTLSTITEPSNTNDVYSNITFSPLTAISSVVFRVTAANQTAANGNPIGSSGTLRLEDYISGGTSAPLTVSGTVSALAAVPEAGTWAMMVMGFGLLGATMRRRKVVFA